MNNSRPRLCKTPPCGLNTSAWSARKMPMLDAILAARREAGLTQAQVAERMGTKAPAVARLEAALISGKPSPSLATLRKYAAALGKRMQVRLV